jgi:type VI secretion system protein ImpC
MPKYSSLADVELDIEARPRPRLERPEPETPFRILVLGDFSGRANRGVCEATLAGRKPVRIDPDNFEQVLEKLRPELRLPVTGAEAAAIALRFRELEDFHPDRIFEAAELFGALRQTREKLGDRATFAAAAEALRPVAPAAPAPAPPAGKVTLDDLLGEPAAAHPRRALDDWERLIRDLVAPHLVPGADPRQAELIAQVDSAIAAQMRALLHQPGFQDLEAAWRALFFLLRRLETGVGLKLFLLDISKAELGAMLEAAREDLRASDLYKLLVEQTVGTPGAEPWGVLAGDYYFDESEPDLRLLARLGAIAREAEAPFLAGASPRLLQRLADGSWTSVRRLPQAPWMGLAMPRFLLRLPYGKETAPTERFAFEEMPQHEHEAYLWGNPALACLCLLAQELDASRRQWRPASARDLDGLPLHVYREDSEDKVKPCAEVLMREAQAEALLENGIMPLVSLKDRDVVRLLRFQSIAEPLAPLAGRWT